MRAVRIGEMPQNATAVHVSSNDGHYIKKEKSEILAFGTNLQRRKLREALLISKTLKNINTDPGGVTQTQ